MSTRWRNARQRQRRNRRSGARLVALVRPCPIALPAFFSSSSPEEKASQQGFSLSSPPSSSLPSFLCRVLLTIFGSSLRRRILSFVDGDEKWATNDFRWSVVDVLLCGICNERRSFGDALCRPSGSQCNKAIREVYILYI